MGERSGSGVNSQGWFRGQYLGAGRGQAEQTSSQNELRQKAHSAMKSFISFKLPFPGKPDAKQALNS